jgi:D-alanyl-D-alanine carboxypeptidase/D-alanyl-D-alanine-endopeptidase (penicillin-binding protein 4)
VIATSCAVVVLATVLTGALLSREPAPQISAVPQSTATPTPRPPLVPELPTDAPLPTTAGLRASLRGVLTAPGLGSKVSASVVDVESGRSLLALRAGQPVVPASTIKIATAVAALTVLPADLRLSTRVVRGAQGDVVLVGGGDPTLAAPKARPRYPTAARLGDLATQLTRALRGAKVRRVVVDDTLFRGPRTGPGWKPGYLVDGDVVPVSALELAGVDVADPALDAGRKLAALLGSRTVVRGVAPAGAAQLARVSSAPIPDLVEDMLLRSDNDLAEALGRHVALATGLPATFDGAAAGISAALRPLLAPAGLPARALALQDASGLSPLNRVQPVAIARLLALAASQPRYGAVLSGLPVGGFSGTLQDRFRKGASLQAAGVVRGKTGTLTGVSALAGLVRTRSGRLLAFDLTADGIPERISTRSSQAALDAVAAALASCGCP